VNCKFCSLSQEMRCHLAPEIKSIENTITEAKSLVESGITDLFLMTTAVFPQAEFLNYGRAVRAVMPQTMRMVANVGDF
ncbi:MAG: radical SAM protein, partial [Ruthenibacterium sp.]